jgi:hypothetical protein
MDPKIVGLGGGLFLIVYLAVIAAIIIYAFKLVARFVSAQERVAGALETIARKLREHGDA